MYYCRCRHRPYADTLNQRDGGGDGDDETEIFYYFFQLVRRLRRARFALNIRHTSPAGNGGRINADEDDDDGGNDGDPVCRYYWPGVKISKPWQCGIGKYRKVNAYTYTDTDGISRG